MIAGFNEAIHVQGDHLDQPSLDKTGVRIPDIPDAESIRQRLAVVTTEASLLRAQLRVSKRLERERERLRALQQDEAERHDRTADAQTES